MWCYINKFFNKITFWWWKNTRKRFLFMSKPFLPKQMSEFNQLLGDFLDKLIISLDEISTNTEKFIQQCVEKGCVPPHPADVARKNYIDENFGINVDKILEKAQGEEKKKESKPKQEKKQETQTEQNNETKKAIKKVKEEDSQQADENLVEQEESVPASQQESVAASQQAADEEVPASQRHRRRKHRKPEQKHE